MEKDMIVWILCLSLAVVGSIFLAFGLAGKTVSIPTNEYNINGEQVMWIIHEIHSLIIGLGFYIPFVSNVLSKLIKRL